MDERMALLLEQTRYSDAEVREIFDAYRAGWRPRSVRQVILLTSSRRLSGLFPGEQTLLREGG